MIDQQPRVCILKTNINKEKNLDGNDEKSPYKARSSYKLFTPKAFPRGGKQRI